MKKHIFALFIFALITTPRSSAQENLIYQKPPKEIMALVEYERAPAVRMDTKKEYMVLSYRDTYKTLDALNQPEIKLAGLRINSVTNIASDVNYENNLKVRKVSESEPIQVKGLPQNPKIANMQFSPDEKLLAFTITTASGVELWVLDIANAQAKKITEANVNASLDGPFSWLNDSRSLLVRILPKEHKPLLDDKMDLPAGPIVSVSKGIESQNRTYPDLLKNRKDEANFETLCSSELHIVNTDGGDKFFMKSALYAGESISPDGKYVMITTIERPYSYIVPVFRFPQRTAVYDIDGNIIKVVNEVPLAEAIPKGFSSTRTGKRNMSWRPDKAATLSFIEALDGGDQSKKVEFRDELFEWDVPFSSAPVSLAKIPQRAARIYWGDASHAIFSDTWYDTRNTKTYLFNPSDPSAKPVVISDRNSQDAYSDPGNFHLRKNGFGKFVLAIEKENIYLIGDGFTEDGQFPFIDELNLKSMKTKRLYQSAYTDKMEELLSIEDLKNGIILVRIQSKNEFPNYYFRNIRKKGDNLTQLTFFRNPFESIANVHKEVIKYNRKDGIELSGTLYLPVGYDMNKKERMPLLIWAYPREFKDANSASQSTSNPNKFTVPYYGSFVYWVTRGYVVLDNASFPILGEGEAEPNDTFIEQLIANAEAAIDAVDKLGYIDRKKVAVGGHSYGAFMTANLLTHSNLFACGIARSGAYNRTLTPFGFQNEQRNYWDVPDVYTAMSPFMNADKMKTPILLVHGEADNNPGTFTLQTERYFQALKGLGAPARMVLLPKEAHSYVAKENILHLLWEQDRFLEKYLKGK
ncbi:MAG: prolyl oligopeptidase family serine peptidase [Rikenellaceae bacterium]